MRLDGAIDKCLKRLLMVRGLGVNAASFGSAKSRMMTNVRRIDHDERAPVGSEERRVEWDSGVQRDELSNLIYVSNSRKVTYMIKTQVYLRKEELDALRVAAARSGRSVAALVREAIRRSCSSRSLQARLPFGTASRSVRPSNMIAFTTSPDASRPIVCVFEIKCGGYPKVSGPPEVFSDGRIANTRA